MQLSATAIAGVVELHNPGFQDARGAFQRLFDRAEWSECWGDRPVGQVNHSRTTTPGALRGLHLQLPPAAEAKLVRCIRGRVLDVAVDFRAGSPSLCRWHGVELSPAAANALFIPEGCAHGFQVLEAPAELIYVHSGPYSPEHEWAARWDDPRLAIAWPLPVATISERDAAHPLLTPAFAGLEIA
jgi:dTDP-4-dehydrorhamnose 3,5-epimerase